MTAPSLAHAVAAVRASLLRHLDERRDDAVTDRGRVGVAFSGGVDSTLLVALAQRALGPDRVVAVLAVSASLAARERHEARRVAAHLQVPLVEVVTRELDDPSYRANAADRCYFCKHELFSRIDDDVAAEHGLAAVAYGENADDARRPDRPGGRAATDHGVLRPLSDAGLTKDDVRRLARELGLPTADKPAAPCLASRIPHHTPVTAHALQRVERAEQALHDLGLDELRVRHHDDLGRVELGPAALAAVQDDPTLHDAVVAVVVAAGYARAEIDPRGLQSGAFTMLELTARPGA